MKGEFARSLIEGPGPSVSSGEDDMIDNTRFRPWASIMVAAMMLLGVVGVIAGTGVRGLDPGDGIVGPPESYPMDVNANGLIDYFLVTYSIQTSSAFEGRCRVTMLDSSANELYWIEMGVSQGGETTSHEERFTGSIVYNDAVDGPYSFRIDLKDVADVVVDSETIITAAWSYTDFDHARFVGDASEYAWSETGDPPYTKLVLEIDVEVSVEGDYLLYDWLIELNWIGQVHTEHFYHLTMGVTHIVFDIPSYQVAELGNDGPYMVQWNLMDYSRLSADERFFDTRYYQLSDFDPEGNMFGITAITWFGPYDGDEDGEIEAMQVDFTFEISFSDWYQVGIGLMLMEGDLEGYIGYSFETVYLDPGSYDMSLFVATYALRSIRYSGPVAAEVSLTDLGYIYMDYVTSDPIDVNYRDMAGLDVTSSWVKDRSVPKHSVSEVVLHGCDDVNVNDIGIDIIGITSWDGYVLASTVSIEDVDRDGFDDLVMWYMAADLRALRGDGNTLFLVFFVGDDPMFLQLKNVKM